MEQEVQHDGKEQGQKVQLREVAGYPQQYIHEDPLRIDQSDSESESEYNSEHLAQSERKRSRIEEQENNCEGHQGDQHHKEADTEKTSESMEQEGEEKNSNFKGESPSSSMQMPQRNYKGVTGIANMRNTCYMNSALQALRHNTEVSAFFLENKHEQWLKDKAASPKVELVKAYADLLRSLWSASKPAYIKPEGFLRSMIPAAAAAGFDQFQIPIQHDSHEFLTFLLDQIHEGMAEEVNIQINRPKPITPQDFAIQNALESWRKIFGKQYSPFTEMIYGLFRVTMTCQNCMNKTDSWETFNCLKLSFPADQPATIYNMIKEEFKEEEIEGYACEKCSPTRTTAKRHTSIWRLPRMVLLVLKRFTPDGRKIYTKFEVTDNQPIVFKNFFSTDSPEPSQSQGYEYFATVDHHGSAGGGHYTAQAKSPLSDTWNMFDDETTYDLDSPKFGESTYILFLKPTTKAIAA